MDKSLRTRRAFIASLASGAALLPGALRAMEEAPRAKKFSLNYITGSCMYGYTDLAQIVPEVKKTGASHIDIWPKVHGSQREQLDELGEEKFKQLLRAHKIGLGCITQYKLGPFDLQDELRLAKRLGCKTIVTGGKGPKGLEGAELKAAVKEFIEKMKPQLDVADETGVDIAIENHGSNIIESPDSLKWLLEFRPTERLGVALAPYHLPQDEKMLADLIRSLGDGLKMFYAWQHGMGCMTKLPKEQELLQMAGRGSLDFKPLLAALRDIKYKGWTEIFMHPVPRGIPIMDDVPSVTKEINLSRAYLEKCIREI